MPEESAITRQTEVDKKEIKIHGKSFGYLYEIIKGWCTKIAKRSQVGALPNTSENAQQIIERGFDPN
jgi:hypothetical protein